MSDLGGNGAYVLATGVVIVLLPYEYQGIICFCGDVDFVNDVEHRCFAAKCLPIPPHLSHTQPTAMLTIILLLCVLYPSPAMSCNELLKNAVDLHG